MNYRISIIAVFLMTLCSVPVANAGTELIHEPAQFKTNAPHSEAQYNNYAHLLDKSSNTLFLTDPNYVDDHHYLTVSFENGIEMEEGDNLVVVLTRPQRINQDAPTQRNPTAMEIWYTFDNPDNDNWEPEVLAHVYFLHRGSGTTELSEALSLSDLERHIKRISAGRTFGPNPGDVMKEVKGFKFVVTMNNGRYFAGKTETDYAKKIRPMTLGGFQIYKAKTGERVVGRWIDRFHLNTDISYNYDDYKFEHTQGVLKAENRNTNAKQALKDDNALNTLNFWDTNFDKNTGKWIADTLYLKDNKIEMPDYTWVTSDNNPVTLSEDTPFSPDLKLQRTATVEHLLYAVQGEPIVLYPFYTMPGTGNYNEKFIHWYDYTTGGHLSDGVHKELLGFVADPAEVFHSKNHGWYASTELKTEQKEYKVDKTQDDYDIYSVDDYINFMNAVNNDNLTNTSAILHTDLDFEGRTIDPIGKASMPWRGTFKGNNHIIRNLHIESNWNGTGIFGSVADGAVVENLVVDSSCTIKGGSWVGVVGTLRDGGTFHMNGVVNHADVTGKGNTGGLFGGIASAPTKDAHLYISNCAFTGTVSASGSTEVGLIAPWLGRPASKDQDTQFYINFHNIIITGTGSNFTKGMEIYRYTKDYGTDRFHFDEKNCYAINTYGFLNWNAFDSAELNSEEFLANFGDGEWSVGEDGFPVPRIFDTQLKTEDTMVVFPKTPERKYGTYATFFHPRLPFDEGDGKNINDMRPLCKNEFVIAADIAQNFSFEHNVKDGTIIEPIIQFRHIFRVRDGWKFAEDYMASAEGNAKFIKENRRHITAAENRDFQIRLDHPYPVERTTRGVFYYKIDNSDYRRICSRKIRVLQKLPDGSLNEIQHPTSVAETYEMNDDATQLILYNSKPKRKEFNDRGEKILFYPTGIFDGQGSRTVDDVNYYVCGGGGHYFRMLACDGGMPEGTYIVQVIGTDYDGEVIKLFDDPDTELLVQEFEIKFLPESAAVMVTEEELTKYPDISPDALETRFDGHSDKIDFDEYSALEKLPNASDYIVTRTTDSGTGETLPNGQEVHYFRWPQPWERSNYGFGYNVRGDFAMQMIVDNQAATPYHSLGLAKAENGDKGVGLFDRHFYDKKDGSRGYFYYVNAADDPGIIARLRLETFCPGTTVHVSCWIAEFSSSDESANLSFNFVARLKNGDRIPMHSHVTGYVGQLGDEDYNTKRNKWLYVYASFVPILTDKDIPSDNPIDHYEIELDNNANSSVGADYAVDDIRVFTVNPQVEAEQMNLLCGEGDHADVKVSAKFDVLLQNLGLARADKSTDAKEVTLYYTFLDKKKFDAAVADEGNDDNEIFRQSRLRFDYDGVKESDYGKLVMSTYLTGNVLYDKNNTQQSSNAYYETKGGADYIVFNANPKDDTMQPGKEYIISILTRSEDDDFGGGIKEPSESPGLFISQGVKDKCAKMCLFTVASSNRIKVDGVPKSQMDAIDACRNQSPVIQVNLYAKPTDSDADTNTDGLILVEENAVFDWYAGSMEDFTQQAGGALWNAIGAFRDVYPDATAKNWKSKPTVEGKYTEEMRQIIAGYCEVNPDGNTAPTLFLAQSSYVFPPLVLESGQEKRDDYVLAIPIQTTVTSENGKELLVCSQPAEVHIVVHQHAPRLDSGIHGISYPKYFDSREVPLRISLSNMKLSSTKNTLAMTHPTPLVMPFRRILPVTPGVQSMGSPIDGSPIELVYTDDPAYKHLGNDGLEDKKLWEVGVVKELNAKVGEEDSSNVAMVFYDSIDGEDGIEFKEGYEYRMRFLFVEQADGLSGEDVCWGHVVFTVKIVPEYQMWTGNTNLNWNNDKNWRRVSSTDISVDKNIDALAGHLTDGSNDNPSSYAPLNFTKVVIPQGSNVPELFSIEKGTNSDGEQIDWDAYPSSDDDRIGVATSLVQYDMIERAETDGTYCRPWIANWCKEIHFEPGSEIGNQQYLHYDKAWVDMEVSPSRWYTLSSPLQGVVAGDMYLPSDNARQSTPYFEDIIFNTSDYNRFKPAVFQRSWNLASAVVYNHSNVPNDTTDVKVLTTWSNVYNDVRVPYSAGHGFSIKTDLAGVAVGEGKVKFRLPKADKSYLYYTNDGQSGDLTTNLNRSNPHKLNPAEGKITIESATDDNKLFLVGNPFMAHLDVGAFLDENSDVITPKYWILDGDHQGAAVMDDAKVLSGTLKNSQYISPMQGFFVEAKTEGKKLTIRYKADMAKTINYIGTQAPLKARGRTGNASCGLKISAKNSGAAAMIIFNESADKCYNADEDVMFVSDATLDIPTLVYTVAEGTATTINTLPEIVSTEIGVIAKNEDETTLVFDGVDSSLGLMLYDSEEESYTYIYDGMELEIKGSSSRRLFIVGSIAPVSSSDLEILLMTNAVMVKSAEDGLNVRIYDISGRIVDNYDDGGNEALFNLSKGIYIVEASDAVSRKTQKVLIK